LSWQLFSIQAKDNKIAANEVSPMPLVLKTYKYYQNIDTNNLHNKTAILTTQNKHVD
jgi:hypothetical protein